jgi:hypothetical protein
MDSIAIADRFEADCRAMSSYEIIDVERGDVLAAYASFHHAKRALAHHVEEHPEHEADLGIAPVDEKTGIASDVMRADELHALR